MFRYAPHGTPGDDWVHVGARDTAEAAHAEAARLSLETGVMHAGGHPAPPPVHVSLRAVVQAAAGRFDARPTYVETQKELTRAPTQLSLF